MKLLAIIIVLCVSFSSCVHLKLADDKRSSVKDIGIEYEFGKNVETVYQPRIDSVINFVINQFNSEHHSFIVHKAVKGEENKSCLKLNFKKAHYKGSGALVASYIITPIGLIVTPMAVMTATSGQAFFLFWYLAADKINITASLSTDIADVSHDSKDINVRTGATFSNRDNRLRKISNKLGDYLYTTLVKLDKK